MSEVLSKLGFSGVQLEGLKILLDESNNTSTFPRIENVSALFKNRGMNTGLPWHLACRNIIIKEEGALGAWVFTKDFQDFLTDPSEDKLHLFAYVAKISPKKKTDGAKSKIDISNDVDSNENKILRFLKQEKLGDQIIITPEFIHRIVDEVGVKRTTAYGIIERLCKHGEFRSEPRSDGHGYVLTFPSEENESVQTKIHSEKIKSYDNEKAYDLKISDLKDKIRKDIEDLKKQIIERENFLNNLEKYT